MSTLAQAGGVVKRLLGLLVRFYLLVSALWGGYYALQGEWAFAAAGVVPLVAYVGYIAYRASQGVAPASADATAE